MKKLWKTRRLIPGTLLLMVVLTCGAVFAYMFMTADPTGTKFIPAQVSCEVHGTKTASTVSSITVENTGNIEAYLRVRLVTYWVDGDENIVAKPSPAIVIDPVDADWLAGSDNTYYYKTPVAPGVSTENLLSGCSITLKTEDGYQQVLDILGEAIQANPIDAVTGDDSWNVTVNDTTITSAP